MNISARFIRRPIATAMLMAAILLLGLISYELLPVAALPNIDFADDPGHRAIAGRGRADRRRHCHDAARTAVRPNPRPDANDLEQRHRICRDHIAIRPQPHGRLGGAGRAGGDQCGGGPIAADDAEPADLSQDQPGRHAGPDAGADLADPAADHGQRLREQHPGAEDFADAGGWRGRHRRRAEPGDPGAGQPGAAGRSGARSRGGANGTGHGHGRSAQGHIVRREPGLRIADQRPADDGARVRRLHPRQPNQRLRHQRAGARPQCRPGHRRAAGRDIGRLDEHRAGHHLSQCNASRAPMSSRQSPA